jgi:glutathione S-transferase
MKLINSFGPNPRLVRMFMTEKGITMPFDTLDILAADNRKEPYLKLNPGGQMPALQLDNGTVIAETAVICEYLEEIHPTPALIGTNAEERARTRMWLRRVELNITENIYGGFRYAEGLGLFQERMHCIPAAAADLKQVAQEKLAWLDGLMNGRDFIVDNQLRLPDIALYCCMDFAKDVGQPLDPALKNISAWFKRMDSRASAQSSLNPGWDQLKMRG